jgi:hypothetical protein
MKLLKDAVPRVRGVDRDGRSMDLQWRPPATRRGRLRTSQMIGCGAGASPINAGLPKSEFDALDKRIDESRTRLATEY